MMPPLHNTRLGTTFRQTWICDLSTGAATPTSIIHVQRLGLAANAGEFEVPEIPGTGKNPPTPLSHVDLYEYV